MEMITTQNLAKQYRNVEALRGISLNVHEGELFAYLGPNGSGKTTTIKILTGLTRPTSGEAFLNGFHVERDSLKAKTQSGYVPQTINLDNELSVGENLDIHGRLFRMRSKDRKLKIDELLEYVGIRERKHSPVKELSGGMKRRVMVARALLHDPKILFLDEPTVGLDPAIRRKIWALIKKIQQNGTTVFLTTHYIEEAEFLADRVAFLNEGILVTVETPRHLMDQLGAWALDKVEQGQMQTLYFRESDQAKAHVEKHQGAFTLRRVNLEDVFIALTGKKVQS